MEFIRTFFEILFRCHFLFGTDGPEPILEHNLPTDRRLFDTFAQGRPGSNDSIKHRDLRTFEQFPFLFFNVHAG